MKLPENTTFYLGGRKIKGEVPDNLVPDKLKKKSETKKPAKKSEGDSK